MKRIAPLLLGCAAMSGAALLASPVSAQQSQETKRGSASLDENNLSLELFGNNITDKYAATATGDPTQNGFTYLLRPREIGIELRYAYDRPRR